MSRNIRVVYDTVIDWDVEQINEDQINLMATEYDSGLLNSRISDIETDNPISYEKTSIMSNDHGQWTKENK